MAKSKEVMMVQVKLKSTDNGATMTTWVDKKPNLAVGAAVRLDGSDTWYKVEEVYNIEMTREQVDANRNWDNNNYDKHDGTALKDRK